MRIIFQNGEIAEINNIHSISINNDMECNILDQAIADYITKEDADEQHASDQEVCDGPVS